MQRWGKNLSGTIRWFCPKCNITRTPQRPDRRFFWHKRLFVDWLTGTDTLSALAIRNHFATQTLTRWFLYFWEQLPQPTIPQSLSYTYLVVDAVYLAGHHECVLIGRTGKGHVFWLFAPQETLGVWISFFGKLKATGCYL